MITPITYGMQAVQPDPLPLQKDRLRRHQQMNTAAEIRGADGNDTTIKVKDPMAKGHVVYEVPIAAITLTHGLTEALAPKKANQSLCGMSTISSGSGNSSEPPRSWSGGAHRSCVCRLHLEGRCGQGKKCKSLHVDPTLISRLRKERNVEFDDTFLSEVVVQFAQQSPPFAIRYTAAQKTAGLDEYKRNSKLDRAQRALLCPAFNPVSQLSQRKGQAIATGLCPDGAACKFIHAQASELRNLLDDKQHTPCCALHGDISTPHHSFSVARGVESFDIPWSRIAPTKGLHSRLHRPTGTSVTLDAVCEIHLRSRCKFGRCCQKLHLCRDYYRTLFPEGVQTAERWVAQAGGAKKGNGKKGKGGAVPNGRGMRGGNLAPLERVPEGAFVPVGKRQNSWGLASPMSPSSPPPLLEDVGDLLTDFAQTYGAKQNAAAAAAAAVGFDVAGSPASPVCAVHPQLQTMLVPRAPAANVLGSPVYCYNSSQLHTMLKDINLAIKNENL
eukprot:TRINITY_DN9626_c0_g2_i1.p1 TRINITY_DN9626_c0_g2~~TRINITY_DN9626_c0_g2_i1.p1  ORF type:complete len:499 (+),score=173.32 TRINITY_DN9626_c0_g2_i1:325-1821(+)